MTAIAIRSTDDASAIRVTKRKTDPVLAKLESHLALEAAWLKTGEGGRDLDTALGDKVSKSYAKLIRTAPTTLAGCAALLRYVEQTEEMAAAGLFSNCSNPVKRNGKNLLSRIATILERIA